MAKQFKNLEEMSAFVNQFEKDKEDMFGSPEYFIPEWEDDEVIINALLEAGYTDLNNLVADGHDYELAGYKNNGWLYEDEIMWDCIDDFINEGREIRKRQ